MIKTFVGLPGAGKSLYFSWLIATEIKRIERGTSKYDVIAINFDWNDGKGNFAKYDYIQRTWTCGGKILAFDDLPDLYNVVNCLVFVDEAGYLLNAMDWNMMDEGYKGFLLHHRKNITDVNTKRFDLYIATQHKDIVEITLRRISNNIYWIRPLFLHKNPDRPPRFLLPVVLIYYYKQHEIRNMPPPPVISIDGEYKEPPEDEQLETLRLIHVYWIGKRYRNYYNTLQKVVKKRIILN